MRNVFKLNRVSCLEICAVSRHSKKEIGRCFKLILKSVGAQVETVTTGDFMVRKQYGG